EPMRMATTNVEQGDVTLIQEWKVTSNEMWKHHSLSSSFHQNDGVREEQICMLRAQVSCHEPMRFVLITKYLGKVGNRRSRDTDSMHARGKAPKVSETVVVHFMRD